MAPAPTLTFKGPAAAKRASKPVVRLDPIVPRTRPASASTSTEPKKRRLSTARDDSRSPDKPARRARVSDDDEEKDEDELEVPIKKKQKGKGVEREREGDKKAPTKRAKAVEHDEGSSTRAHVTHEERVSRDTVDKRWRHLSASTSAVLRQRAQDVIEDTLRKTWPGSATDKSRQAARKMLNDFTDEVDAALAAVVVPPLPSSLPQALKGKGKDGKADLVKVLDEDDLQDQLASIQAKLDAAEGDADDLEAELDKERRLLKRDKARLVKSG